MKSSSAKKASITLPPDLERDLRLRAKKERRTLSGVIQEASRYYIQLKKYEDIQRDLSLRAADSGWVTEDDVDQAVHEVRKKKES